MTEPSTPPNRAPRAVASVISRKTSLKEATDLLENQYCFKAFLWLQKIVENEKKENFHSSGNINRDQDQRTGIE